MADQAPEDGAYSNIREILGCLLNQPVVDITQHDPEEWAEERRAYVCLHFANGVTLRFWVTDDGFDLENCPDEGEDPPDADGSRRYAPHG